MLARRRPGRRSSEGHELSGAGGSRVLRHEIVVGAPVADAWAAFTTRRRLAQLGDTLCNVVAVGARVRCRICHLIQPERRTRRRDNIHHRMLVFHPRAHVCVSHIATAERLSPSRRSWPRFSRSSSSSRSAPSEPASAFRWSATAPARASTRSTVSSPREILGRLEKLAERFETGPIDWKKALEKPAH